VRRHKFPVETGCPSPLDAGETRQAASLRGSYNPSNATIFSHAAFGSGPDDGGAGLGLTAMRLAIHGASDHPETRGMSPLEAERAGAASAS